ncbi:MAG: hypothetical protein V7607_2565 [Solirubrobacteraceae bacterium]
MSAQQDTIAALRADIAQVEDVLVELRSQLANTRLAGRQAAARGDDVGVAAAASAAAVLADREREAQENRRKALTRIADARGALINAVADPFALLDGHVPLLLAPVRLEARFAWLDPADPTRHRFAADGATEGVLLVRIYPDDLHVDSHDEHLTGEEQVWQRTWLDRVNAGRDLAHFLEAWDELIARAGPRRAAWIAHRARSPRRPTAPDRLGRPAQAAMLPDRWLAVARTDAGEHAAISALVAEGLAVTPDPAAGGAPNAAAPAGRELAWLTDFDAALRAGMAIRIAFPAGPRPVVERLVVVGACAALDPDRGADTLSALLDAHHYTDGLSFLEPGAPTNSTPAARAAMTRAPSAREVFDVEGDMYPLVAPARTLVDDPDADGATVARMLGLDPATFGHVAGADALTGLASQDLRTILAHTTLPHLRRLLDVNFDDDDWQLAQALFVGGPGALGPAPVLRVGNQPYGLLAVALRRPGDPDLAADAPLGRLVGLLDRLRTEVWEPAAERAPRIGAPGVDPASALVDILRTDGVTRTLRVRAAVAPDVASALQQTAHPPDGLDAARDALSDLLDRLGASDPRTPLIDLIHLPSAAPVRAPLVQAQDAAGIERVEDYLYVLSLADLLGVCNLHDIAIENYSAVGGRPAAFLFALARAALLTAADGASRRMLAQGAVDPAVVAAWDADTSDGALGHDAPMYALAERLMAPWPDPSGAAVHVWLTYNSPPAEAIDFLTVRGAIRRLALPSPTPGRIRRHDPALIEQVLRAELGLLSHRLDAWYSSVATERLWISRAAHEHGLALGGFGVLERIAPTTLSAVPSSIALPDDVSAPVFTDAANAGFVHAPSATQAAAAAVLRSAHLAHHALAADPGRREAFAVELSSRRVRDAIEVIDGLREGQPFGALLGYRIERLLLRSRPEAIAIVRAAAPLVANRLHLSSLPAEAVAADNVVDGLLLLSVAGYTTGREISDTALRAALDLSSLSPADGDAVLAAVVAALREAVDVCDAVADLTVAEGVHQLVQGNPVRSGGAVDAVAGTETLLQQPVVAATPRSGAGVVHRLVVALDGAAGALTTVSGGWAASPRARLDPALERWARTLLPDPGSIGLRIEATNTDGEVTISTATLAELHAAASHAGYSDAPLGALDLVASPAPAPDRDPADPAPPAVLSQASSVGARLHLCARLYLGATTRALRLLDGADAAWTTTTATLADALYLAATIRDVLGHARSLLPADLSGPGARPSAALDGAGLRTRTETAAKEVDTLRQRLVATADAFTAATVTADDARAQLTAALLAADHYGIEGALPSAINDTLQAQQAATALAAIALRAAAQLAARLDALNALPSPPAGADADATIAAERARAETLFGRPTTVTVDVVPADGNPFGVTHRPTGATDDEVRIFCARAARVRPDAARLDLLAGMAEALHGRSPTLAVAQVPVPAAAADTSASNVDPARWAALPAAPGHRVPAGRVSIVAHLPTALSEPTRLCGLAIDEWVETVPATHETTSVAFHYDAPSSAAPNVLLLAAHPPGHETWTADDAVAMVDEALAIARLRAVDPQLLDQPAAPITGAVTQENTAGDVAALGIDTLTAAPTPA